ncbi:uncharacterized protein LOC124158003 isoform X2 [Ischnura elegans]|uniref:uncharacterized protein LOC124158003 isoform X2 n=1 Tax=Ischnura elegans TaxID=197161 RepID=UPI001ED870BB|nr:uncharacterized protein LOC124158003 isoform X2 [Ischnura elegans]
MKRRYLEVIKMSGRKTYVYCSVPRCESTSHKTPEKYFFVVPKDPERRKRWYDAARRQHIPSEKGCYRICEDHFNYEADLKNYQEHRLTNARPLLKKDAVPSKFDCQSSRKRKEPRISSLQRARKQLIGEIIAGHQEDNNRHQEPLMENLLPFQSIVANCECVDHQGDNNEQQEPLLENLLPFHSIATNCESTDGSASIGAKDAINPCTPPRNQQKRGQKQKKSHFRSHGVQVTPRMHGRACWPVRRCWEKLKCEAKKRKVADLRRKMGLTEETNAAQMEAGDASQDGVTEDTFDSDYRYLLAAASCPSAHQPAPSGSCGLRPTEPPHSPSDSRPIPSVSPTQSSVGSLSPSRPHYMSLPTAAPCINSTCPPSFSLADSEIHATNKSCRSDHQGTSCPRGGDPSDRGRGDGGCWGRHNAGHCFQ